MICRVERIITWLCLAALVFVAGLQSVSLATSVLSGKIRQFAKYGVAREILLSQEPIAFCTVVVFYLLLAGMFWYFVHWVWIKRIRGTK